MYVETILPLAVPGTFTYAVPPELGPVQPGVRVAVPMGRGRRMYSAIVRRVSDRPPEGVRTRPVISVLDATPVVTERQLALWDTIADHYVCTLGEVMIAALPGQLLLHSETRITLAHDGPLPGGLPVNAAILLQALGAQQVLTLDQAAGILGVKDPMRAVKALIEQGAVTLEEKLKNTWRPRMVTYVRLAPEGGDEGMMHHWFNEMEKKAPKQLALLMRFVELSRCFSEAPKEVERTTLLNRSGATADMLRQLVKKGMLETYEREADRPAEDPGSGAPPPLSHHQQAALGTIQEAFNEKGTVLLQGVTSSGKTEVYAHLIEERLAAGRQVLYLLPEIALTTQMIARLRKRFGDRIAVFHSRMPQRERTDLWMRMLEGHAPPIVVGARSAIFLPFHDLGLVVVDEEHDPSYKQHDPAPRYHARDMAIVLAALHGARAVLGSATPSMESMFNARSGKYGLAELRERHGQVAMPRIVRVDLRDARKRKAMHGRFSRTLIEHITEALGRREQAILFQNRRGYVPVWQCGICGWVPQCDHCDVSLTYHKQEHRLRCHYCARHYPPPTACGHCASPRLRMLGFGTEKVEEELAEIFPEARVARMDQDTARGKQALERILDGLAQGGIDILVGTQMVTKGLDFDHVSVVGVLHADRLLRFPDFRAHERAFQLMAQVAGRAGRRSRPGTVVVQADEVDHPVLDLVARHDVNGMYEREIAHRRGHGYPPFTRLVKLVLKHRHEDRVASAARALGEELKAGLGDLVLGPDIPPVSRVKDRHLRHLLVKLRRSAHAHDKAFLRDTIDRVMSMPEHSAVQLVVDADPV
ncbi:MAG: primosomal protein N' [Flavobacteriales bacterium]|jgi:primosomal protein N' (replication factor Y)|nr:primosomal protein N' [Flavobacteriales bacterium]